MVGTDVAVERRLGLSLIDQGDKILVIGRVNFFALPRTTSAQVVVFCDVRRVMTTAAPARRSTSELFIQVSSASACSRVRDFGLFF